MEKATPGSDAESVPRTSPLSSVKSINLLNVVADSGSDVVGELMEGTTRGASRDAVHPFRFLESEGAVGKVLFVKVFRLFLTFMIAMFGVWLFVDKSGTPNFLRDFVYETSLLVLLSVLVFFRAWWVKPERGAWLAVAAALAVWVLGDIGYYLQYGFEGAAPTSGAFENNWISAASYVLMYVGVILLIKRRLPVGENLNSKLALNSLMAVLIAVAYMSLLFKVSAGENMTSLGFISSVANLILSMVLVALLFAVFDVNRFVVSRMWWFLLFGAVVVWYADVSYYITESYLYGTYVDFLWVFGLTLIAFAAWEPSRNKFVHYNNLKLLISPAVTVALSLSLLLWGNFYSIPPISAILMGCALAVAVFRLYQIMWDVAVEEKLYNTAFNDDLTEAKNSFYLSNVLKRYSDSESLGWKLKGHSLVLIFIDVNNLREINETFGVKVGNDVIREMYSKIFNTFGEDMVIVRIHAAQFGVLYETRKNFEEIINSKVGDFMNNVNSTQWVSDGVKFTPSVVVSAAAYPNPVTDCKDLPYKADVAMGETLLNKEPLLSGTTHVVNFYHPEFEKQEANRFLVEHLLSEEIEGDRVVCHYQPKLDLITGLVNEVEVLARWKRSDGLVVPPHVFLPAVERSGKTFELFTKVLHVTAEQLAKWREESIPLRPSINVSTKDVENPKFISTLVGVCEEYNLPHNSFMLEILESKPDTSHNNESVFKEVVGSSGQLGEVSGAVEEVVTKLTSEGFSLSLDDFGVGTSNFKRLNALPFNEVKVDKSLIRDVDKSFEKFNHLRKLVEELHNHGVFVVAEGVETAEEFDAVVKTECDYVQGYYVGIPMTPEQLGMFLEKFNPQTVELIKRKSILDELEEL